MSVAMVGAGIAAVGVISSASSASKANKTAKQAAANQEAILSRQEDRADAQWENYIQNYLPIEQEFLESAKNFDTLANRNEAAQDAAAGVSATFANARERLAANPGINQNSQAFLNKTAELGLAEAATSAAAQTGARQNVQRTGAAMLQDAAGLGKGMASGATNALNAAASGANGFANATAQRADQASAGVGNMVGGLYKAGAFDAFKGMLTPTQPAPAAAPAAAPVIDAGTPLYSGSFA